MQTQSVVAVCAANVCRSPVISFLTSRTFIEAGAPITFTSAGAAARGGVVICPTMRSRLSEWPGWPDFAAAHRSSKLGFEQIDGADLILTATAAERGAVALLHPAARERTFTLLEAAALAEDAVATGVDGVSRDPASLAAVMNARRGWIERPKPSLWRRATPEADFDVPDAHTSRARHERVFRVIEDATSRWEVSVAALTAGS